MEKLYIKNMVCDRCKMAVKKALDDAGLSCMKVELGEVELDERPSESQLSQLKSSIESLGFELIEDKTARMVSQIKNVVLDWVRGEENKNKRLKFSVYLSDKLHKDYNSLSSLFPSVEGTTIEQFIIRQKIERVKELLVYDELNLSQIADALNYSSVQHLSNQFKKITGLTPSYFKKLGAERRLSIDKV